MSDPIATSPAGQTAPAIVSARVQPAQGAFPVHRSWKIALAVAIVMVLLALLGVGLSTSAGAKSSTAYIYWVSLVPLYGLLCVWAAWARTGHGHLLGMRPVYHQAFHWLGVGVALALDFLIRSTGEESSMGAGMVALLVLALGCYLAGIHFEWLFILVGVLLSLTLLLVAYAEEYLWLVLVVGVLAILLMVVLTWLTRATRSPGAVSG
jgi:hypothetical protein